MRTEERINFPREIDKHRKMRKDSIMFNAIN
jgi:hypothetical protein